MAAKKSQKPPKNETLADRLERTLPGREWVVTGHVFPQVRGKDRYQRTVFARTAVLAIEVVTVSLFRNNVEFYLHRVTNTANVGGFGPTPNAMGPV